MIKTTLATAIVAGLSTVPALASVFTTSDAVTFRFLVHNGQEDTAPAVPSGMTRINAGAHIDLAFPYVEEGWELHAHLHAPDTEFEPDEVEFYADNTVRTPLPAPVPPQFAFLGAAGGSNVWILPQSSNPNAAFLGLGTEEADASLLEEWDPMDARVPSGAVPGKFLRLELVDVEGPGQFSLYQTDGFGNPTVWMASSNGIDTSDVYLQLAGGHDHANWAFTAPGEYEITFRASTTVVPEPGAIALLAPAMMMLARRRR